MNAEIFSFYIDDGEKMPLEAVLHDVTKELDNHNISLTYKTEAVLDHTKMQESLKRCTDSGDDIGLVIMANAVTSTDDSSFFELFSDIVSSVTHDRKNFRNPEKESDRSEGIVLDMDERAEEREHVTAVSIGDLGNGYHGYTFKYKETLIVALPSPELTGKSISPLILNGVLKSLFLHKEVSHISYLYNTDKNGKLVKKQVGKKKRAWYTAIIPWKGDSGFEVFRKAIVIAAAGVFIVAGSMLLNTLVIEPIQNEGKINDIQNIFFPNGVPGGESTASNTSSGGQSGGGGGSAGIIKDWDAVAKVNSDIIGWLIVPKTQINYPVLKSSKDKSGYQFYLHADYYKGYSFAGSVFMDYRSSKASKSKNIILHGHNMLDGSMFANLLNYSSGGGFSGNLDFYKSSPVIEYDTPEGDAKWKIISIYKTSTLTEHGPFFNYLVGEFESSATFMNYVQNVRERSLIDTPVTVNENDQLITLSTCSYEYKDFRTVVVARRVRNGESPMVEVSKAKLNTDAVWPGVHYSSGKAPKIASFKTALAAGQITWYDGTGALEGSETLPTVEQPTKAPTKPPATQAPTTKPAVTNPPPTQAPTTKPPATNPPPTQAPTTKPPATNPPPTQAPTTTVAEQGE